jgi:hypothetical protein
MRVKPFGVITGPAFGAIVFGPHSKSAAKALSLVIRLVNDVKPKLVAKLDKGRLRGIMRGADTVDVELLHFIKVKEHVLACHAVSVLWMCIVVVYALQLYAYAVDEKFTLFVDTLRSESDLEGDIFSRAFNYCGVEIGLFCVPENLFGAYIGLVTVCIVEGNGKVTPNGFIVVAKLDVMHVTLGARKNIYVTEYSVIPEHVLAFEI